jgi:hypothetical protein
MLRILRRRRCDSIDRKRLEVIDDVVNRIGRGVFKRIDENRELLELLQMRCSEFMTENSWVEGWLRSHDDFFSELATATQAVNPREGREGPGSRPFPRPWPRNVNPHYAKGSEMNLESGDGCPAQKTQNSRRELFYRYRHLRRIAGCCYQLSRSSLLGPRGARALFALFLLLIIASVVSSLPAVVTFSQSTAVPGAWLCVGATFGIACMLIWRYTPSTYDEILDMLLTQYVPLDEDAFGQLRTNIREYPGREVAEVQRWVELEKQRLIEAHPRYRFHRFLTKK